MAGVVVSATQRACGPDTGRNLDNAEDLVRRAASEGAQIILLQELFESVYFCKDQDPSYFELARPLASNPVLARFADLAKELGVVLPFSFFERARTAHFNSLVMIDADGTVGPVYRKSHIPDGPGYQEKFYFSPGDTGFRVWDTAYGRVGCAICWDQWFPEAARAMALMGADILLYPTAIGSEPPPAPPIDSRDHWRRVMQGHAAANLMPVVASNRVGVETGASADITFYGTSFIADETGAIVAGAGEEDGTVITARFDFDALRARRVGWGVFRDRRPDLYVALSTFDGG